MLGRHNYNVMVGMDELEGVMRIIGRRIDDSANDELNPKIWMLEGAYLTLMLFHDTDIHYPQDFVELFDMKCSEIFRLPDD